MNFHPSFNGLRKFQRPYGGGALKALLIPILALILVAMSAHGAAARTVAAQSVAIVGNKFYLNGKIWIPKGIKIEAFRISANNPITASSPSYLAVSAQATQWYGNTELQAARSVFGANVIAFNVSQPNLDPSSTIYDPKYEANLLTAFQTARDAGFAVIVDMDAQNENGILGLPCMPDDSTVRAWQTLAPALAADQGIMFELFNEPCMSDNTTTRSQWASGMQAVINAIRALHAPNILLLDGTLYGRTTNGYFTLVTDTLINRMALAVHPYLMNTPNFYATPSEWANNFGRSAQSYPLIVTEWNATNLGGCAGPNTDAQALSLLQYLSTLSVGIIGWGIDSSKPILVKDHTTFVPTDFSAFTACGDNSNSGEGGRIAAYPNN